MNINKCSLCSKSLKIVNLCSLCLNTLYCDKVCQENHWKTHKKICKKNRETNILLALKNNDISKIKLLVNSKNVNNLIPVKITDINLPLSLKYHINKRQLHDTLNISLLSYALTIDDIDYNIIEYLIELGITIQLSIYIDIINNPLILILENINDTNVKEKFVNYIITDSININSTLEKIISYDLIYSFKYLIDKDIININYVIDDMSLLSMSCMYRNKNNILKFLINANAELIPYDNDYNIKIQTIKKEEIKNQLTSIDSQDNIDIVSIKINSNVQLLKNLYNDNHESMYRDIGNELFHKYAINFSWCILTYNGALTILNIINYINENSDLKLRLLLEVGGGSGFNSAYLNHVQRLEMPNFESAITIKCTDPELDINKYNTKFYNVEFYDAITSINKYSPKILFVSRARAYITNAAKLFIDQGGLIIIMLGEECQGETYKSCAPSSFYNLIKANKWKSYELKNSIINWHLFGEHDVGVIHYSPTLTFLPDYLKTFD